jgi:O-antigen/teichoic acid export membrane protein
MSPPKALSLRQNFSWTFTGNIIYAASQWGMLVILAKLGSPEMVGKFTLGLAVAAPVILLCSLQLRQIQVTDVRQQYLFADYLGLRLICMLLSLVVIALITLKAGYQWETSLIILIIGLSKALESISDIFHGLFQYHERMDRIAISLMIKGPLSLLMLGVGVRLSNSVLGGAIGLAIAWLLVLVFYDLPSGAVILKGIPALAGTEDAVNFTPNQYPPRNRQLQPRFSWATLQRLIWLSLPLGFVMMLISLNTNIPRYFIERYLGERELGIFSALSYLMVAGGIVVNALGQSASPRLSQYYAAGKSKDFRNLVLKTMLIGALLGGISILGAAVAGKEILTLLYRPEYAKQLYLFVLLMVAAGAGYVASFLGYGMTAAQFFRVQMPLFMIVTGISSLVCWWLVPTQGLIGAAIALIVGAVVQGIFALGVILYALHKLDKLQSKVKPPAIE